LPSLCIQAQSLGYSTVLANRAGSQSTSQAQTLKNLSSGWDGFPSEASSYLHHKQNLNISDHTRMGGAQRNPSSPEERCDGLYFISPILSGLRIPTTNYVLLKIRTASLAIFDEPFNG
ncbi:hypothetical protein, partial [Nitrosovibrio sp. Nv17]|uniref:hypothetical protein n=1 Tax=Nitrosovibrio sp. Nv17 TaxID=1855339 RepID=UPI001C4681DF